MMSNSKSNDESWQQDTPTRLEQQLFLFLGRHPSQQWKCVKVSFALSTNGQPSMTATLLNEATGLIEHLPITDSALLASLQHAGTVFTENVQSALAAITVEVLGSTNTSISKRIR